MQEPHGRSLTITVLTFRRPAELQTLLPVLVDEIEKLAATSRNMAGLDIVVIDNDPAASAADPVAELGLARVRYVHEPISGIAAARNRALTEAAAADLLVFIDDDELPVDGWLGLLLDAWSASDAVAVAGAVRSEYDGELDPWIVAGEFFRRRRLPTGTPIDVAATNNLLLDLREVRRLDVRFDERYGLSGGEDTLFTRTLVNRGAGMIWSNEAIVTDRVPRSRMTRDWVLRRAMSSGNTWSLTSIELATGLSAKLTTRLRCLGTALIRIVGGLIRFLLGTVTRSARHQAKGARTFARGAGMATGAAGIVYREYRRKPAPVSAEAVRS